MQTILPTTSAIKTLNFPKTTSVLQVKEARNLQQTHNKSTEQTAASA